MLELGVFLLLNLLTYQGLRAQSDLIFIHRWKENNWIHTGWHPPTQNPQNPSTLFITSTKIKQHNSNFVPSNFWTCWWILWSRFFMHRIYFISWRKEKARIKFMNFSQKYMGSVCFFFCLFFGHPVPFQRLLGQFEIHLTSFRIWTRVVVFISNDGIHYTTNASTYTHTHTHIHTYI